MTANAPKFSALDKIAAMRQILSVAKRVMAAKPDVGLDRIARVMTAAVYSKLEKLESKVESLTDVQLQTMYDLQAAVEIMPQVINLLTNSDTTRELTDEEVQALVDARDAAAAKRKEAAAKRKAEKEANAPKAEKAKAPAKAEKKADAKQLELA